MVGLRVSRRVARVQGDQRFVKLLMWSLVLHVLCAPAQIFIVDHLYNGVADYTAYVNRGAFLADNLRSGMFTFANTRITGFTGDNLVYVASGVVQTVLGPNKLAEFIFFSGIAFLGEVCFLRAYSTTFPEVNPRRYALLIFFLPSLLFWTADISKETIMTLAMGVAAYGAARVLMRVKGGYKLLFVGVAIGIILRPNEVVLLLAGLALAMLFRATDVRKRLRGTRKLLTFVTVVGGLALAVVLYEKIFHQSGSVSSILQQLHKNNSSGHGVTYGSSNVSYSSNPLYYPKDIYTVMFDPLPITAHGKSELLAGLENTVILVLILASLRQLRCAIRACRLRPYVLLCVVYSALFMYAFAALGNLGLIYRERTLLLPFLLVLLAIPVAKKGSPPQFPWEKRVLSRKERRRAVVAAQQSG
jgi:hypothetical protein